MTFDCKDLERALAVPELLPDAREHAKVCDACSRELWLWSEMSAVAPGLREEWETPDLWPKIRRTLVAHQKTAKPHGFNRRFDWRMIAGIAAVLAIAVSILIVKYSRPAPVPAPPHDSDFLTEQTLKEVEQTMPRRYQSAVAETSKHRGDAVILLQRRDCFRIESPWQAGHHL